MVVRESSSSTVSDLEATLEDLQKTNEHLITSSEALASTNEELQSVNESLYAANAEFKRRLEELEETNADLEHLLRVVDVGVLFLDESLALRRFNDSATRLFPLRSEDVGRPVTEIAAKMSASELKRRWQDGDDVDGESVALVAPGPGSAAGFDRSPQFRRRELHRDVPGSLSPTERGSATHRALQWMDLRAPLDTADIAAQLSRMKDAGRLSPAEADAIREVLDRIEPEPGRHDAPELAMSVQDRRGERNPRTALADRAQLDIPVGDNLSGAQGLAEPLTVEEMDGGLALPLVGRRRLRDDDLP